MSADLDTLVAIRLSERELSDILRALDSHVETRPQSRRRSTRHPLRGLTLTVIIEHTDGTRTRHLVKARNISAHGAGFLNNGVMLPGTGVTIELPIGTDGASVRKPAVVRRCAHVRGMVHEIGVEFGTMYPAKHELPRAATTGAAPAPPSEPAAKKPTETHAETTGKSNGDSKPVRKLVADTGGPAA